MSTRIATSVAPINIHGAARAPHLLLPSPPSSRPSSPVPPPPSPASIPHAAPTLGRRAVFELRSSSPLSPSAAEKTLLKVQLERAKQNRVLLRSGKPARPLSQKEWRRLAAEEQGAETSPSGVTVGEASTGSNTPLSLSDSDRNSLAGLPGCIEGLFSGDDKSLAHEEPPPDFALDVAESASSTQREGSTASCSVASSSPAASPPRRATRRSPFVNRLSRTAPTTPSISPTSQLSSLLSRRPSVKVELATAFATGTPIRSAGSIEKLSSTRRVGGGGKTWSAPQHVAPASLPLSAGIRRRISTPTTTMPVSPLLGRASVPPAALPSEGGSSLYSPFLGGRRRQVSNGSGGAVSPISPPRSQSVMASDPRDLTLQFTRRNRPGTLSRSGSSTLISAASSATLASACVTGKIANWADDEPCDSTELEETDSDAGEGWDRAVPYFGSPSRFILGAEPSIFASPGTLTPTASLASTSSVSPLTTEPARSNSLGYWSIHSSASASASSTRARARSVITSAVVGGGGTSDQLDETVLQQQQQPQNAIAETRKPVLPALQATAVPSGLVQAIPVSPTGPPALDLLVPLPPPPPPAIVSNPPSQLAVALAPAQRAQAAFAANERLDLAQLRREQLARRRAVVELERGDGSTSESAGINGTDFDDAGWVGL
ncbi:hypothetical protein JCM3774_002519 [Rhodotorula dairenensis]